MSKYDEYQIVINAAQRRWIMRALTNAMANDRRSTESALSSPTSDEWMQLIRLFSTIKPSMRKACLTHGVDEQIPGLNEQVQRRGQSD